MVVVVVGLDWCGAVWCGRDDLSQLVCPEEHSTTDNSAHHKITIRDCHSCLPTSSQQPAVRKNCAATDTARESPQTSVHQSPSAAKRSSTGHLCPQYLPSAP